jgi:tRNA(Ile2)-agmatinylcytidine synthase
VRETPLHSLMSVFVDLHIGIDDVDSPRGGCTTHFAYTFLRHLLRKVPDSMLVDYPNLVRLNPAIPFKTRGNGGVSVRIRVRSELVERVVDILHTSLDDYVSDFGGGDTGALVVEAPAQKELTRLYWKALTDYVHKDFLMTFIKRIRERTYYIRTGKGLVGAAAAIGWHLPSDCTYELILYRKGERCVAKDLFLRKAAELSEVLFSNWVDGRLLITPHGPDPVLAGIRGEEPSTLLAFTDPRIYCMNVDGWMIYRTNQGTNQHHIMRSNTIRPYQTGCIEGVVVSKPEARKGGDVVIKMARNGVILYAAFFQETGLNKIARELLVGDALRVCGTAKYWDDLGTVIHAETLTVWPRPSVTVKNPRCPRCGARMKSAGRGKGWKCPECGYRSTTLHKEVLLGERNPLLSGLHVPRDEAIKHLIKPRQRYGKEKICAPTPPITKWSDFTP